MRTSEIRSLFLTYFEKHGHTVVQSSSLVPGNDPTLLFTNAGMVQFKDVFLGLEQRPYARATTAQRCVRAGGKHNDLDNVGYTARHHTFFEMLGNFSFGDYFKREAITFAWRFLTVELNLPPEKLWVTVYKEDKESEEIWLRELGIDPVRFSRCGEKDNFWSMGDTGPCGPCTEIFYDHGADIQGGPPGSATADGDRYIEIWNIVFMQFNRDAKGALTHLPHPCVDTGMGLERIAAVLQGVHNNYEIDLFQDILKSLSQIIHQKDLTHPSMRVIADHIRSCSFLIMDGVLPSNEGRGYVLRRIIRRALRHAYKLGMRQPFFYQLVFPLAEAMGSAYPELYDHQKHIEAVLEQEERQFIKTLEKGMKRYEESVGQITTQQIPGELVFLLYDTYGFPPDLTADIAREAGMTIDEAAFEQAMKRQREQSQESQRFKIDQTAYLHLPGSTEFVGYDTLLHDTQITALLVDNNPVNQITAGSCAVMVLSQTPFYAESGGQVGDRGHIFKGTTASFRVDDTQKKGSVILHWGTVLNGEFRTKDAVTAEVSQLREATRLNHSATHLMHEALRRVLGKHVTQKGSLVDEKRLRFDFAHPAALSLDQIHRVEQLVNEQIRANGLIGLRETSVEEAKASGAMALFGEKYADRVRVIEMGAFSSEICGGTHATRTGDLGFFKIIYETAVSAGIRRVEAVTGAAALQWVQAQELNEQAVAAELRTTPDHSLTKVQQLVAQLKEKEREFNKLQQQLVANQSHGFEEQFVTVGDFSVLVAQIPGRDRDSLRQMIDQLKSRSEHAVLVLATIQAEKVILLVGMGKQAVTQLSAVVLLKHILEPLQGKGGGRPDFAQGGSDSPEQLEKGLARVIPWVKNAVK